jgi:hypothetical protein
LERFAGANMTKLAEFMEKLSNYVAADDFQS